MSFSILFVSAADRDSISQALDYHMIKSLAETGHRIGVLLNGPLQSSDRVPLEQFANVHFVSSSLGPKLSEDIGHFAWRAAQEFSSGAYEWVIARGLALSRTLTGNESVAEKLWPLLPDSELQPQLELGVIGQHYLDVIMERSAGVFVERPEMRDVLGKTNNRLAAKIFAVLYSQDSEPDSYLSTGRIVSSVLNLVGAERRVLVFGLPFSLQGRHPEGGYDHVGGQNGSREHVVWVTDQRQQGALKYKSCTHVHIDPTVVDDPRKTAWRLRLIAEALNCDVVISGDTDVSYFLLRHVPLAHKVWPLLNAVAVSNVGDSESVSRLVAESASTVVVVSSSERSILESLLPSTSGRIVVASSGGTGISIAIQRRSVDYVSHPCRAKTKKILFASHDFKFCGEIIAALRQRGDIDLKFDFWTTQNSTGGPADDSLLGWADVVFCDFASPNIGWYIRNKRSDQKLVVRMHGYELHGPWLADLDLGMVDRFIFVSELLLRSAIEKFAIAEGKTSLIPNMVDTLDLKRPKLSDSRFHIGVVGMVPILKRPDRVLDLLEILSDVDSRYAVHIKGRHPWQYGWVWNDKDIRDSYESFYARLATNPRLFNKVGFDGFGPSMGQWFQKVGWMLSPSTRESFHLGPVEGMASGAVPVVWAREGASDIFDRRWVHRGTEEAATFILHANETEESYKKESGLSLEQVRKFDSHRVKTDWIRLFLDL